METFAEMNFYFIKLWLKNILRRNTEKITFFSLFLTKVQRLL